MPITSGVRMKFWKRPIVRQHFHRGLLWRVSETEEVASSELFEDLLYVGIIAINGDNAVDFANRKSLLRFYITFILSWKLWSDLTMIISWFETAINIEHKSKIFVQPQGFELIRDVAEPTNAFVTLVSGYSVVAMLYQTSAPLGINAVCVDVNTSAVHMGYILAAAALAHLVIAHDCSNADTYGLPEAYVGKSECEISMGLRWFYCAGLGIALACMGIISMSHVHKLVPGQRLKKSHRLAIRFAVAIIVICLPLADSLNSLQLIGTTTGLTFFVLTLELMGSSCVNDAFVWDNKPCNYTAQCNIKRKDVENAIKTGEIVNVRELAKQEKAEYGAFELS
ncbi:MAG: hypothetical protein M1835_004476 [Candelina submexicana]|nr:MAG: hypothetical protein M1835_004476 [Candelina submexicana]